MFTNTEADSFSSEGIWLAVIISVLSRISMGSWSGMVHSPYPSLTSTSTTRCDRIRDLVPLAFLAQTIGSFSHFLGPTSSSAMPTEDMNGLHFAGNAFHAIRPRTSQGRIFRGWAWTLILGRATTLTFLDPSRPKVLTQVLPSEGDGTRALFDEPLLKSWDHGAL